MDSGGPYRRISRPGRLGSGSGGRGGSGGGAGSWLWRRERAATLLLAAVLLALLALQLRGSLLSSGEANGSARPAAVLARARGASDASRLVASEQQGKEPAPLAAPTPTPTPNEERAAAATATTPPPQPQRWPRGVPRSIKAARWEAAASSAPTGGRGPGAGGAASAASAVPPAACTGRSPSLPSVQAAFCEPLFCLRSAAAAAGAGEAANDDDDNDEEGPVFVDLAFSAFTRLEFSSEAEADAACGLPLRGQAGPEPPPGKKMASGTAGWRRAAAKDGVVASAAAAAAASASDADSAADNVWTPPPPEVSFLLTVHNNAPMVVETVLELFRTSREARSVEFVVVDDGSTEDMGELALVGRVIEQHFRVPFRMVRNSRSVGFGEANTQAAKLARGEFLALINSDALVTRGWLAALLAAHRDGDAEATSDDDGADSSPSSTALSSTTSTPPRPRSKGVGMAGPLFLNSTGHVMEAGGVVWADATAANYGRREPVPRHEHLYARRADYMSAACVLVRREVFVEEIGGFDPRYGKGYWEDTDLAMSYAAAGYEVRYVPAALVLHDEGGSLSAEKQALMEANRRRFLDKWRTRLQEHHCPLGTPLPIAADRGAGKGRLLWVDDIVPEPDRDSGSIRTLNALRILIGSGFRVSYQPTAGGRDPRYMVAARNLGVDVLPLLPADQWRLRADGGAAAAAARAAAAGGANGNNNNAAAAQSSSSPCLYDVIVVARFYVYERAAAALRAACPGTPVVFDTVDVHFLREARMAISAEAAAAARLAARREASAAAARELGGGGGAGGSGAAEDNSASVIVAPGAVVPRAPVAAEAGLAAPPSSSSSSSSSASWNFDHTDALAVVSWLDGKSPAAAAARRTRDREIALVRASTVTVVVSEVELPVLRHYAPGARLAVVSNVHDVDAIEGEDDDEEDEKEEERQERKERRQRRAIEGALAAAAGRGEGKEAAVAEAVAAAIGVAGEGSKPTASPTTTTKTPSEEWIAAATAALAKAEAAAPKTTAAPGATTPALAPLLPTAEKPVPHREGRACAERSGVLFVGNFNHLPNQQAVRTLLDDVLPAVADVLPPQERSSLVLHIVGSNRAPDAALAGAKVTTIFHGWLSDAHLRLLYGSVKVVVAPLLSGAGVKGKINQAMLYGVPVVATPVAAEGMHLADGVNALVASSPREFAERTLRAYTDCPLWEKLVKGGKENIRDFYSMDAAEKGLLAVMAQAGVPAPGKSGPAEQTCDVVVARPAAVAAAVPAAAAKPAATPATPTTPVAKPAPVVQASGGPSAAKAAAAAATAAKAATTGGKAASAATPAAAAAATPAVQQ